MRIYYVEIGLADFDRYPDRYPNKKGIVVEPIKYFLDLIDNINVTKFNCALGNSESNIIYYPNYEHEKIEEIKEKYGHFVNGLGKIGEPHSGMAEIEKNYPGFTLSQEVEFLPISEVLKGVTHVTNFKVDTEGMDIGIVNSFLDLGITFNRLQFEFWEGDQNSEFIKLVQRICSLGYKLWYDGEDAYFKK